MELPTEVLAPGGRRGDLDDEDRSGPEQVAAQVVGARDHEVGDEDGVVRGCPAGLGEDDMVGRAGRQQGGPEPRGDVAWRIVGGFTVTSPS